MGMFVNILKKKRWRLGPSQGTLRTKNLDLSSICLVTKFPPTKLQLASHTKAIKI